MEEFGSYQEFAKVYDELMDNVPYEKWCDFVSEMIEKYGVSKPGCTGNSPLEAEKNLVLDLGCGTGKFTRLLQEKGYDVFGVDSSEEMLSVAMEKEDGILYLLQDMRELELYSTVGTVVSVCDCVNYILEEEELVGVFSLVNNYLFPKGLFLFDFNTVYKYEKVIGDRTIAENREDCSFIWENFYYEEEQINEYDLTIFIRQDKDRYERFRENHYQRGYEPEKMKELIEKAGLSFVLMLDADTLKEVTKESQRVYILARENGKQEPA